MSSHPERSQMSPSPTVEALGREWVPTANTRLEPAMRITAVIAPEAEGALQLLRAGCAADD